MSRDDQVETNISWRQNNNRCLERGRSVRCETPFRSTSITSAEPVLKSLLFKTIPSYHVNCHVLQGHEQAIPRISVDNNDIDS
jgi:hypothetical protein